MNNNSPVLLIVFNRPDTTQKVFDAIRRAKPKKLYIAADAPREGNESDVNNCALVKEIVESVDWDCENHYKYANINQGCGNGVYNAISWAFENEDRLIIIEDDCVPALPFFDYCDELLEKYIYDTRIWVISGSQFNEEAVNTTHDYFFSRYGHIWGWATWKRCWATMDMTLSKFPLIMEEDLYKSAFRTKKEAAFFRKKYSRIYNNKEAKPHTWDRQFDFSVISNGGLCIVPKKNLITNIGYLGSHAETKNSFHDRNVDNNFKINSHPEFILCDRNYDTYHFNHHIYNYKYLFRWLALKVRKIVKKKNRYKSA